MTDVVAALIWDGNRFLACQRPAHKARGLLWEFVGGKVEPGETKEEALIRECREELDITVRPGTVFMELVHEYPDLTVRLTLLNATITEGQPRLLEHNDIRWISVAEIDLFEFVKKYEKYNELVFNLINCNDVFRIFENKMPPLVRKKSEINKNYKRKCIIGPLIFL